MAVTAKNNELTPADDRRAFPVTSRSGSSDTTCFQPRAPEEAWTDHVTTETKNWTHGENEAKTTGSKDQQPAYQQSKYHK